MWKCRSCGLEIMFRAVTPELDADGCYFLCPGCQNRNTLVNVGGGRDEDGIQLAQPTDE